MKKRHNSLKTKLLKLLEDEALAGKWFFFNRLVGKAYFKRGEKYIGPYAFGHAGQFDCYLMGMGKYIEVEFKGIGDKLSEEQLIWISFCQQNEIPAFVLYEENGEDDFNALKNYLIKSTLRYVR